MALNNMKQNNKQPLKFILQGVDHMPQAPKLLFGRCCAIICGDFLLSNCTFIKHIKRRCGNIFAFCQVLENGKCAKSAVPYTPVYYSYHDHAHNLKIAGILISCNGTELRVDM